METDSDKSTKNAGVEQAILKSGKRGRNGTTYSLARLAKVAQPSVIYWLYHNIPPERAIQLEELTGVPRSKMRPDLYK